jgi:methyltransferase (TIGR00027 family)
MALRTEHTDDPVSPPPKSSYSAGREPSFTAMWHACLRNTHATAHASPVFSDTRSVQLVPDDVRHRVRSVMDGFSQETADAIVLMSVIRHRVLAERLTAANDRGLRQLVILGAGLDTTAFGLPAWGSDWRVFEVDHPVTQDWKRAQSARVGWRTPPNLVFASCDFETQDLPSALAAAGFDRARPAVVSLFGVLLYLTLDATTTTLRHLAGLAAPSEVTISYSPPPGGTDRVATETFERASPTVDATGESFIGYYREAEFERLAREAGFSDVVHHPLATLNARYFDGRPDRLRLHPIEHLLTAVA